MNISKKLKRVEESPTLKIMQKAAEMKRDGVDVVSFGAGEPDFDTPHPIIDAAKAALDAGLTRYGPAAGIPELKKSISNYILKRHDVHYELSEIIVTCGAKSAIFIALQVLLNPGDEVLIPAPYWVSYPVQVLLADGAPKIVPTSEENKFKLTTDDIEKAATANSRVLILNSPSNPSGSVYSRKELGEIIELCMSKDIAIIADEIYDLLVYDAPFTSAIAAHTAAKEMTIYINGVSKSHAMTGWRVGWAAGPKDVIVEMTKYQGQLLTCIPPFIQKAAISALEATPEMIGWMADKFKTRRNLLVRLAEEIPGIKLINPEGAFYAFINVKNYIGKRFNGVVIDSSERLGEFLLEKAHVAIVPGSAFGMEGYIRLSFATSEEQIKEGLKRIGEALKKLT